MNNETQLQRYKKLLQYIEQEFKEDINIAKIEAICNYSYRNINRIFEAIHQETIGKYIRRIRLERAAQYLKYTDERISEIAYNVGFTDIATFSKAFKKKFKHAPSTFRKRNQLLRDKPAKHSKETIKEHLDASIGAFKSQLSSKIIQKTATHTVEDTKNTILFDLSFEIETLPDLTILGLEYKGSYDDLKKIEKTWKQLIHYASKEYLIDDTSIHLAEILDDDEITEHIQCRYKAAIVLEDDATFTPQGFFIKEIIKSGKYAKFIHKGAHESCINTYHKIYAHWMTAVQLEMRDAPVLEFYLNDPAHTPIEDLLTEIYIPIV